MKKRMAVFALLCILSGGTAVLGRAVPAWRGLWEKTAAYEQEEQNGEADRTVNAGTKTDREGEPDFLLHAQSAVLMDGDSGRILYGKNEKEIRPMASTTKIMTCILALELEKGKDEVTVSQKAASQPQVHLGAPAGRRFHLRDLLYSLMLESHNDSAVMIAEHVGGSTEKFAALMNEKAREIGCTDTFFITPNGLDARGTDENGRERSHSTTAADLARIMRYCIFESPKKEEFLEITSAPSYAFSDIEGKGSYSLVNHNALLTMMEGAFTGKTGFTGEAGYCYVGALKDGKKNFIIALLGCGWPPHKTYKWSDARELFQYGKKNYEYRNIWKELKLPELPVENGIPEGGDLSENRRVHGEIRKETDGLCLLVKEKEEPEIRVFVKECLKAPLFRGDVIGQAEYRLDGEIVGVYPVFLTENVEEITYPWCLKKIIGRYLE